VNTVNILLIIHVHQIHLASIFPFHPRSTFSKVSLCPVESRMTYTLRLGRHSQKLFQPEALTIKNIFPRCMHAYIYKNILLNHPICLLWSATTMLYSTESHCIQSDYAPPRHAYRSIANSIICEFFFIDERNVIARAERPFTSFGGGVAHQHHGRQYIT